MIVPSQTLIDSAMQGLKSQVNGISALVEGAPPKVHLFTANLSPTKGTLLAALTEATFTGSAAKVYGDDMLAVSYVDPVSGVLMIKSPQPIGTGFLFVCTVIPSSPEVVYGYYVTDFNGTLLFGARRFDTPVTVTSVGDAVDVGEIIWEFPPSFMKLS